MNNAPRRENWTVIIIGLAAVVLLAGAVFFVRAKNRNAGTEQGAAVSVAAVEQTAGRGITEPAVLGSGSGEASPEQTAAPETGKNNDVEEAAAAGDSGETAEETIKEITTGATEETTEEAPEETAMETAEETSAETAAETAAQGKELLENLDEYKPGDIIDRERFDFDNFQKYFVVYEISTQGNVYKRINGKSYRKNNDIALKDLRYIQLPHYNFNGEIQLGELIVNKSIAGDIVEIFEELFKNKYQIEKMYLIDNYWAGDGDSTDTASCENNNTSAFCYRQAAGGASLSNHALGLAIDINPQQNPYVSYSTGEPVWYHSNSDAYIARDTGLPHVITRSDLACQLFRSHGFDWGGDWTNPKDYQHFEKK